MGSISAFWNIKTLYEQGKWLGSESDIYKIRRSFVFPLVKNKSWVEHSMAEIRAVLLLAESKNISLDDFDLVASGICRDCGDTILGNIDDSTVSGAGYCTSCVKNFITKRNKK